MNDSKLEASVPTRLLGRWDGDEAEITLHLLDALHDSSMIGQRALADRLGVALGLVNAYVRRCVRKGYIKIQQIPPKRYAYYLTPHGFAEKSRLAGEYLSMSMEFFRRARVDCQEVFDRCHAQGWHRIALWGVGDLCEIATLCNCDPALSVLGIVDPDSELEVFAGYKVVRSLDDLGPIDAVILVDLARAIDAHRQLAEVLGAQRVLNPRMIKLPPAESLLRQEDGE